MKHVSVLILLFYTSLLKADYVPLKIHELILKADKIIEGEISCVDTDVFQINVKKSLFDEEKVISVQKFKGWNCGQRYKAYKVGQKALFFLRFQEDKLRPMGGGNEGELPIINGAIYIHTSTFNSIDLVDSFERSEFKINDNGFNNPLIGYKFKLPEVWRCIEIFRDCYELDNVKRLKLSSVECSKKIIEDIKMKNVVFNWIHSHYVDGIIN